MSVFMRLLYFKNRLCQKILFVRKRKSKNKINNIEVFPVDEILQKKNLGMSLFFSAVAD